MFPHRVSVSYSHRLKAGGVERLHHVFLSVLTIPTSGLTYWGCESHTYALICS